MSQPRPRSDVELLARTRVLIASMAIYLLTMGFMALGERLYQGTEYLTVVRLAAIPFFLLLVIRYLRLVRVRPPPLLLEARQLVAMNRFRAAREKLAQLVESKTPTRRIDRARRLLQDGLAVPVAAEVLLESGRCSLHLGELDRAVDELGRAHARLPARADVAIDLAEALQRAGREEEAARVLEQSARYLDAVDWQTLAEQPALFRLLGETPPPRRSAFYPRILLERLVLAVLVGIALVHAAHLYLGLF
jgi:tetratricopeptide (TPR) repeat protein